MNTRMIAAVLAVGMALTQVGMREPGRGHSPWDRGRDDRRPDKDDRELLTEGSAWEGVRTNRDGEFEVDARVISRTANGMVLRTKEKDNDGLALEWTFEVRDKSLKLLKVITTSKGDGQRESTWGSGEVRQTRNDGRWGARIDVDYGWRFKEGKGNGKGKQVEGNLRLRRD